MSKPSLEERLAHLLTMPELVDVAEAMRIKAHVRSLKRSGKPFLAGFACELEKHFRKASAEMLDTQNPAQLSRVMFARLAGRYVDWSHVATLTAVRLARHSAGRAKQGSQ